MSAQNEPNLVGFLELLSHPAVILEPLDEQPLSTPTWTNQSFKNLKRDFGDFLWSFLSWQERKLVEEAIGSTSCTWHSTTVYLQNSFTVIITPIEKRFLSMMFISPSPKQALPSEYEIFMQDLQQTEVGKLIANYPWENIESLGPIKSWPIELYRVVSGIMVNVSPICLTWGVNKVMIYNDMYASLLFDRHPENLGAPLEVWSAYIHIDFNHVAVIGEHDFKGENTPVMIDRKSGVGVEEAFYNVKCVPIVIQGKTMGGQWTFFDTTNQVLSNRRWGLMSGLWKRTMSASGLNDFVSKSLAHFDQYKQDLPLVTLYSTDDDSFHDPNSYILSRKLDTSFPKNQTLFPKEYRYSNRNFERLSHREGRSESEMRLDQYIQHALETKSVTSMDNFIFPEGFEFNTFTKEKKPTLLILYPYHEGSDAVVIILALNPYVEYDESYKAFVDIICHYLTGSCVFIQAQEAETRKKIRLVKDKHLALEQTENRYNTLLQQYTDICDLSPVGIFRMDLEGYLEYANAKYKEISGSHGEIPTWKDLIEEDQLPLHLSRLENLSKGQIEFPELDIRFKNGKVARLSVRGITVDDKIKYALGCLSDITTIKRFELLEKEATEQRIGNSERDKVQLENFIDFVSHELRNPLSGVWQNAECLKMSVSRQKEFVQAVSNKTATREMVDSQWELLCEDTEAIENILLCTSHQVRIANDILNVSKLGAGLLTIDPQLFDLLPKVQETMRMFEANCSEKGIELSMVKGVNIGKGLNVQADPARIVQILINLVSNAIKYSVGFDGKQVKVNIDISDDIPHPFSNGYRTKAGIPNDISGEAIWVSIAVTDSGRGLTQEDLARVFHRFSQANPKTDGVGGAGLGLFISQKFAELHQGFIEVVSEPAKGSTFRFAFPSIKTILVESSIPSPKSPLLQSVTANRKRIANNFPETRVLVVEDNLINRKILARQLGMYHIRVDLATNGREGLEKILAKKDGWDYDIILMDIEMPEMSGLEVVKEIRRLEQNGLKSTRHAVVAITGNARPSQVSEFRMAGFDDVFIKPYNIAEVVDRIREISL